MARIAGINIPQNKIVSIGLTYIHGIGLHSSKQICNKLNIPLDVRVNNLTEDQVLKITEYINANHKVEGDLRREVSLNIKRLVDLVTYRGTRHKKKLIKKLIKNQKKEIIKKIYLLGAKKIDYIEAVSFKKFKIVKRIKNKLNIFIAYYLNDVRLIDNL